MRDILGVAMSIHGKPYRYWTMTLFENKVPWTDLFLRHAIWWCSPTMTITTKTRMITTVPKTTHHLFSSSYLTIASKATARNGNRMLSASILHTKASKRTSETKISPKNAFVTQIFHLYSNGCHYKIRWILFVWRKDRLLMKMRNRTVTEA